MIDTKPPPAQPHPASALDEARVLIDTSKMSAGQRAALELTEAARETASERSFVKRSFLKAFGARLAWARGTDDPALISLTPQF